MDAAYNVAINIAAENATSGVLAVISKDVLGLHGNVENLRKGFETWAPAITGAASALAGIKLSEMIGSVIEAGNKLEHFKAQLLAATGDIGKVAEATDAAWQETSRNLNSSVSENVKNIQHLMNVTGSFEEAKRMLHPFTVADTALASIKDDEVRGNVKTEANAYNLARSLEQLGVTQDPQKLDSYLAGITRTIVAERGKVDGSSFFTAINNAGASRYGWNEEFVTTALGPLIQATQGKIGNQLYQIDRTFGQGVSSSRVQAEELEKYGLYSENDELWEAGKFKGFKPNTGFEPEVRRANPAKWAGDIREMLRGRGTDVDSESAMSDVIAGIGRGNKTLGAAMSELLLPQTFQALTKEQRNIANVPQDAVGILQQKDPSLAMNAFRTQWDNLMEALGSPLVATATGLLNDMASAFNTMARFAAEHPDAVKGIGIALAGVAAGLVTMGTVLVGGAVLAAFGGTAAVGGAVAGIVGGITALGVGLIAFGDRVTALWTKLKSVLGLSGDDVSGIIGHPEHPHTATPLSGRAGQQLMQGLGMMPSAPGGMMFNPISYGGAANDNASLIETLAQGVYQGLTLYAAGGGGEGPSGVGGGIMNAAYTTYGAAGGGRTSGSGGLGGAYANLSATGMTGEHADYIRKRAAELGIDPRYALAVAHSEGLGAKYAGDYGTSFGDFQLHYGGSGIRGMNSSGLGDLFTKQTGLDARDPRTWKEQIDFALQQVRKGGWSPWHGAARVGIHNFDGVGSMPRNVMPPPPNAATSHPPINVYMDGKIVAQLLSRRQGASGRFPTAVGGTDNHGTYTNPGTPYLDVA